MNSYPVHTTSQQPAYTNMVNAIADYLTLMETIIDSDSNLGKEEKVKLNEIDREYVLDRIEAESDMLAAVAGIVIARLSEHRRLNQSYTIKISEMQRAILEDALSKTPRIESAESRLFTDITNLPGEEETTPGNVWNLIED